MINAMSRPVPVIEKRKRGEAQRAAAKFIVDYKRKNNGNRPTYEKIARGLGYRFRNCARSIVMSCVHQNRPGAPYWLDLGKGYGLVWIDIDDDGLPIVNPAQFDLLPAKPQDDSFPEGVFEPFQR